MPVRTDWNRDQLLLALRLYMRTPFGRLHGKNPDYSTRREDRASMNPEGMTAINPGSRLAHPGTTPISLVRFSKSRGRNCGYRRGFRRLRIRWFITGSGCLWGEFG